MKSVFMLLLFFCVLLAAGCGGTSPQVVSESAQDYKHLRPYTKIIGENHAHLHVYHRRGEIYLYISDVYGDTKQINASVVEATMTLPNREQKKIEFQSSDVIQSHGPSPTDSFFITGDWIKSIHEFTIEFLIPIGNKIYEVSFDYKTSDKEDSHHKHAE